MKQKVFGAFLLVKHQVLKKKLNFVFIQFILIFSLCAFFLFFFFFVRVRDLGNGKNKPRDSGIYEKNSIARDSGSSALHSDPIYIVGYIKNNY